MWAKPGLFLFVFVLFSTEWQIQYKIWLFKTVDGLLGTQTRNRKSTELWQPPKLWKCLFLFWLRNKEYSKTTFCLKPTLSPVFQTKLLQNYFPMLTERDYSWIGRSNLIRFIEVKCHFFLLLLHSASIRGPDSTKKIFHAV